MAKKRSPRLASVHWRPSVWEPNAEDIGRLDAALGRRLSPEQQEHLRVAVNEYLLREGRERAAPLAGNEPAWLERLEKASADLGAAIDETLIRDGGDGAARQGLASVQAALNSLCRATEAPPLDLTALDGTSCGRRRPWHKMRNEKRPPANLPPRSLPPRRKD
jgi:hypothetical protein